MKAVYILAIIVFVFAVLLVCPVILSFHMNKDGSEAYVRYAFVKIKLNSKKEDEESEEAEKEEKARKKKKEKKTPDKEKSDKPNVFKEKFEKDGLKEFLQTVKYAVKRAVEVPMFLKRHTVISRLIVNVSVSDEDAATAAVNYGRACPIVYSAYAFLTDTFKCKKTSVNVYPDFKKQESEVEMEIKIRVKLIFLVITAFKGLFAGIDIFKAFSRIKNIKQTRIKTKEEGVRQ